LDCKAVICETYGYANVTWQELLWQQVSCVTLQYQC